MIISQEVLANLRRKNGFQPGPNPSLFPRRGGVLVEFALISLVLYLLLAATFEMGRAMYSNQALQSAADVAAREFAHAPLGADTSFDTILQDPGVRQQIYDDEKLVLDPGVDPATLPVVNQALYNLMITDHLPLNGNDRDVLRYPGAILTKPNGQFTVGIPVVTARSQVGTETIRWVPVLEEIKASDGSDPFRITSPQRGLVAVRLNYPFQAASLSGFQDGPIGPSGDPSNLPIQADDAGVQSENQPPDNATPLDPGQAAGTYAGPFGLGRQFALTKTIRPFRKLLSAQAIFRRDNLQ